MRSKQSWLMVAVVVAVMSAATARVWAQGEAAPAAGTAPAAAPASGLQLDAKAAEAAANEAGGTHITFWAIMTHSGIVGILIWLGLFGCSAITVGLAIDSFINITAKKMSPQKLVDEVRAAMEQGDVVKAISHCEQQPGPLANILKAGFSNVQEGYEVVQDAVGVATDLESEKVLQKVGILNVMFNLGPMVGLIGTVQGMINAFGNLATTAAGAAQQSMLALSISESLWATAAGLIVAVVALSFYQYFRNRTMRLNLGMEGLTLDLIKSLKNVEVVTEE